ncbi:syndecan-like isoform X2 [Limulus polyphemus]|uniref:Syndecan n=1 Tax=Limulus polyphemus TaxID=6850 RepID=A0ABM1TE88_LIMPO|nr:syndecan-like isoform X2 [Limulus polyphemus]
MRYILYSSVTQGDLVDSSSFSEFSDIDHSSGRGSDDEDTSGSGDGPEGEEKEEGSGGIIIEDTNKEIIVVSANRPHNPTWLSPFENPVNKADTTKKPPLPPKEEQPDHKNHIPNILKPTKSDVEIRKMNNAPPVPGGKESPDESWEDNDIHILGHMQEETSSSFFAQPGILASVIGGAVIALMCIILMVMFIVYRMKKKDEGSYIVGDSKGSKDNSSEKGKNKEIFA